MGLSNFHIAVLTAFHPDETLNIQATIDHIKYLQHRGVSAVFISGSTGEQHSLTIDEKIALIDVLQNETTLLSDMEILFGVSSIRQSEAERLAKRICSTDISGIVIGYPPYLIPTQDEAVAYTQSVLSIAQKPAILYNNPRRTGFDLSVESVVKLADNEWVLGIKEAGDKAKVRQLKEKIQDNHFLYFAGGEFEIESKLLEDGFNAVSSVLGNIEPEKVNAWVRKLLALERLTAEENLELERLNHQMNDGSMVVNMKRVLEEQGHSVGVCRRPLGN